MTASPHPTIDLKENENVPLAEAEQEHSASRARESKLPIAPPGAAITPPPPPFAGMNFPNGVYHPDFMFCGACVTCEEPGGASDGEAGGVKQLEAFLKRQDSIGDSTASHVTFLESKFRLHKSISTRSENLLIQSLLQPLPGVAKVRVEGEKQTLAVEHDASMNNRSVLDALESAGYAANVLLHEELYVRSQFYVSGICCASEVSTVKRILRQIPGVSKLQINITTKVVHVQHDISILSAPRIASVLSKEGFRAQVQRDGQAQATLKEDVLHEGQTILFLNGEVSEGDREFIKQSLGELKGVLRVDLNLPERHVLIDHDVYEISSEQFVKQLKATFDCTILKAGEQSVTDATANTLDRIRRSNFVESTVSVKGLRSYSLKGIENVVSRTYVQEQVRAIYPNLTSEIIKIEHDPETVSIMEIVETLARHDISAVVTSNGAAMNLYLPTDEDYVSQHIQDQDEMSLIKIHLNVWLSGIFWVLSMLSYIEKLDSFKYFGLASVVFGLPPICVKAWRTLSRFQFDANCMMVTAALGALSLQQYDEAGSVAFLFSVSEFLEAQASTKARRALKSICDLRPDHANVIHPVTKEIVVVPADRVPLGSLISVKTGDKIATDGIIVEGSSAIDESSLTGESIPIQKKQGGSVKGGTINVGRTQLVIRSTTTVEDSAVSRLIRLVEEAQSNRSPTEKLIDSFARSYTPSVMFMAILMCTIPWFSGAESGRYWMLNGLIIIVIACPCSLTISTPVTYAAGLAATAQRGIIVKGGSKLEAMGSVEKIVFDKTGTLTKGTFSVVHLEVVGESKSRHEMMELLALVQERSSHPVASSLVQAAKDDGIQIPRHRKLSNHTILKGEGVSAEVDGESIYIGNQRLFDRLDMFDALPLNFSDLAKSWANTGGMVGFVGTADDGIVGIFCVKDAIREEARSVIESLHDSGIDALMCTGDSDAVALAVAQEIGIPRGQVHSQLLPEDKLDFVGSLKTAQPENYALCREKRYVLFIGDGINDAPALAMADIGCSMGEGAALAMEMSDVTLMDSNLSKLSYAVDMGRSVLRTVKENILISLIGKFAVVVLTFTGNMTLLLAIASDVGIMLLVTINGMKLLSSSEHNVSVTNEAVTLLETRSLGANIHRELDVEMKSLRSHAQPLGSLDAEVV